MPPVRLRPQGRASLTVGHPLRTPERATGASVAVRASLPGARILILPTTHGGLRPFAEVTCEAPAPPMGAYILCSSLRSAPLTAQAPKCYAIPGAPPGLQAPKQTDAGGRRPWMEPAQPRVQDAGKRGAHSNWAGGIPKGGTPPFGRFFGYFLIEEKVTPAERRPCRRRRQNSLCLLSVRAERNSPWGRTPKIYGSNASI